MNNIQCFTPIILGPFTLVVPARNIYIFNDEKTSFPFFLQYKLFPNIQFEY